MVASHPDWTALRLWPVADLYGVSLRRRVGRHTDLRRQDPVCGRAVFVDDGPAHFRGRLGGSGRRNRWRHSDSVREEAKPTVWRESGF